VIQTWTNREIHDTVAAIVADPTITGASRRSLLGRVLRYLATKLTDLLHWASGSLDARIITGAGVVIVVVLIVARIFAGRREAAGRRAAGRRGAPRARVNPWRSAQALASDGRFTDASHDLYAAVIADLVRLGLVRFHASKTSRDYVHELRRARMPLAPIFGDFSRAFERAVFGLDDVTREEWEVLLSLAERVASAAGTQSAA
jgi:hypothetical protein